jgi:hypothetical protein
MQRDVRKCGVRCRGGVVCGAACGMKGCVSVVWAVQGAVLRTRGGARRRDYRRVPVELLSSCEQGGVWGARLWHGYGPVLLCDVRRDAGWWLIYRR